MFSDVFKEDLDPEDRLRIEPVKIELKEGHEKLPKYNARVPIPTPRYLEKAADKELQRILRSGALEEVTWPTDTACRAFFCAETRNFKGESFCQTCQQYETN